MGMEIRFWGSRGSLPASYSAATVRAKLLCALELLGDRRLTTVDERHRFVAELPFAVAGGFGTNTACVEVVSGEDHLILDAGTGLRDLGNSPAAGRHPATFHLLLSHPHWDHIQGFPFFAPAYRPGNRVIIHGCHPNLQEVFTRQQQSPCFPVPLAAMAAEIEFVTLEPEQEYPINGFAVRPFRLNHPGDSYAYRVRRHDRTLVYATDGEHKESGESGSYPFVDFCRGADLLIFDAQYTLQDALMTKENWGHSSNLAGVELAVNSGVRRLCLFHSEHTCDDEGLARFLEDTRTYAAIYGQGSLEVDLAYDGLVLNL
jgi:phosphoribosyl 1,2-cyclic phosphodiesterase